MTKKKWEALIREQCVALGTYREAFQPIIRILAEIMEQRDKTYQEFKKSEKSGGKSAVEYTNKAGATNISKNPLLVLWDDLNKSALPYWRDLGLTPAGLKKINEKAMKAKKKSALEEALRGL